jgi:hypothetical protein
MVVLLALLVGVVLLSVLRHVPKPVQPYEPGPYYSPTPRQAASALARLHAPKGFSAADDCELLANVPGRCFARTSSLALTTATLSRFIAEVGLSSSDAFPPECLGVSHLPRQPRLRPESCMAMAQSGRVRFMISTRSVVLVGPHGVAGSRGAIHTREFTWHGTTLSIYDLGVPRPERAETV